MLGVTKGPIKPSPAPVKNFNSTGGTPAPSGRSVAGQMVNNNRGAQAQQRTQQRRNVPRAPARRGGHPSRGGGGGGKPYNALESPYQNQGEFNQAVNQTAKAEYEPELQQFNKEQVGEQGEYGAREGENKKIYENYYNQAMSAFDQAKGALGEVAARQNSSTQAGQQALQAALANTGVSGLQGVSNPNAFMAEATGYGDQSSQTLAGVQSGELGALANAENIPGAWLGEQRSQEGQRHQSELAKIAEGRSKVLANIPNVQAKVRGELSKQEQERQTNKLQAQIAQGKLGLEGKQIRNQREEGKEKITATRTGEKEANAIKAREIAINSGFESKKLELEGKKIDAAIKNARTGEQKEQAKLRAERFNNGLKLMAGYLGRNEKEKAEEKATGKAPEYRRNAQQLYNILTQQGNLTAPEAFTLMESSGNGYVEQFGREHRKIYNRATLGPPTKTVTNKRGGKVEVPRYRPPGQNNKNSAKREKELKTGKTG